MARSSKGKRDGRADSDHMAKVAPSPVQAARGDVASRADEDRTEDVSANGGAGVDDGGVSERTLAMRDVDDDVDADDRSQRAGTKPDDDERGTRAAHIPHTIKKNTLVHGSETTSSDAEPTSASAPRAETASALQGPQRTLTGQGKLKRSTLRRMHTRKKEEEAKAAMKRQKQLTDFADGMSIFLSMGMRTKKVTLAVPTSLQGLEEAFKKAFYVDEGEDPPTGSLRRQCFLLRHQEYGIEYEGFDPLDMYAGALVRVRGVEDDSRRGPVLEKEIEPAVTIPTKVVELVRIDTNRTAQCVSSAPGSPQASPLALQRRASNLRSSMVTTSGSSNPSSVHYHVQPSQHFSNTMSSIKSVIWTTLEDPSSSTAATAITIFILCLILFSTVTFCLETMPIFYEHDRPKDNIWFIMEASAVACFTVEFLLRLFTCPNFVEFTKNMLNAVDFLAIAPFYIELILESVEIPGLSVLRVVRLVRVFRLFKVSRGSITIFAQTMVKSSKPLYMLVFFTSLATILFSSLMYYAERGVYDEELHAWMRIKYYECETYIATPNPYLPIESGIPDFNGGLCELVNPQPTVLSNTGVWMYLCPFTYQNDGGGRKCTKIYEQSPFSSIPRTCWWALTTMTTVGYGDMYPTQWYGLLLGVIVMMFGIIVIALPITVIGSNFTNEYRVSLQLEAAQDIIDSTDDDAPDVSSDTTGGT